MFEMLLIDRLYASNGLEGLIVNHFLDNWLLGLDEKSENEKLLDHDMSTASILL